MYIEWDDVVSRYASVNRVGGAEEVSSAHIVYAESELNGRLSPKFTVPFSSNNFTAKDLSIEMTYVRIGNLNIEDRETLQKSIDDRIQRLLDGEENMMDTDGAVLQQSVGGTLWSSSQDYVPTFGHGDTTDFEVDPNLVLDEEAKRGTH